MPGETSTPFSERRRNEKNVTWFPSFGAKIPQKDLINWPRSFAIGG
jgi:hypothetical protein